MKIAEVYYWCINKVLSLVYEKYEVWGATYVNKEALSAMYVNPS